MKEELLKRLLSLIGKTGDRLVITDPAGESPFVLMGLDHYEKLVVGEWKPEAVKHEAAPPQALPLSLIPPDNKPPKREIPLWKAAGGQVQKASDIARTAAPESRSDLRGPEPEGEEQFYLEPLE